MFKEKVFLGDRFFGKDKELQRQVNLTQEEADKLEDFENEVYYSNGLKWISGGFSKLTIVDLEDSEDGDQALSIDVEAGVQDDCGSSVDRWRIKYIRRTGGVSI